METIYLGIAGGIALGLASTLHCAAMCCGISTGILLMFDTRTPARRTRVLMLSNMGRGISYALLGALFGASGAWLVGQLPSTFAFRVVQWAAAVGLMWVGLSTAGLLPSLAFAERALAPIANPIGKLAHRIAASPFGALGVGLVWGLMPCAMIYAALITAMLTGSAVGGAAVMAGFWLATLPALTFASFGLRSLALDARAKVRAAAGIAIAAAGFGSVYAAPAIARIICG